MGELTIERLGGLAGFGGANLKSEGKVALANLPAADLATVDRLFAQGSRPATRGSGDMFRYRITRRKDGKTESIEVPEGLLPEALKASVKDTLK